MHVATMFHYIAYLTDIPKLLKHTYTMYIRSYEIIPNGIFVLCELFVSRYIIEGHSKLLQL